MEAPFDEATIPDGGGGRYVAGMKVFGGRFVLDRRIGRGGMGEVWLARDTELGDARALKFLPMEVAAEPQALAQLRREALAGRNLSHPRIVRVDDFYAGEGVAAVAMEYVDGQTLNALQAEVERGHFEVRQIKDWIQSVCEALDYAHGEAKMVHRDLKPANIIIERESGRAKVLDFGIARCIAETHTRMTGKDSSCSLPWASPQQLMGERGSPLDDVYSLGATIYELLTGAPPFFRGVKLEVQVERVVPPSMMERRKELVEERMISDGGEEIPELWEQVVAACLGKSGEERPQSAKDLWRALNGEVPTTRPVVPPPALPERQPVAEPVRGGSGRKMWVAGGVAAGVVVLALVAAGSFLLSKSRGEEPVVETPPMQTAEIGLPVEVIKDRQARRKAAMDAEAEAGRKVEQARMIAQVAELKRQAEEKRKLAEARAVEAGRTARFLEESIESGDMTASRKYLQELGHYSDLPGVPEQVRILGVKLEAAERESLAQWVLRQAPGFWEVVEQVEEDHGGYKIQWTYQLTREGQSLRLSGRKTRVNDKRPSKGELEARVDGTLSFVKGHWEGMVTEVNHRGESLPSKWTVTFSKFGRDFSGENREGAGLVSRLWGERR